MLKVYLNMEEGWEDILDGSRLAKTAAASDDDVGPQTEAAASAAATCHHT